MWRDTKSYGRELGDLIEYERGSFFGGLLTIAVFFGFGYLLWSDFTTNLNDKLYTLTIRDKLLSSEECSRKEIGFDTHNKSLNLIFGVIPTWPPEIVQSFDPLDNDYIEIVVYTRNETLNNGRPGGADKPEHLITHPDFDLVRCS